MAYSCASFIDWAPFIRKIAKKIDAE